MQSLVQIAIEMLFTLLHNMILGKESGYDMLPSLGVLYQEKSLVEWRRREILAHTL
jgi:hypothetical protein